jgi:hypothetical protein
VQEHLLKKGLVLGPERQAFDRYRHVIQLPMWIYSFFHSGQEFGLKKLLNFVREKKGDERGLLTI